MSDRAERLAEMERRLLQEPPSPSPLPELRGIVNDYQIAQNIAYALNTGFPEFAEEAPPNDRVVSICGSAPSLKRTYKDAVGDIWACNDAGWFLIDQGVIPKYVMVWDPQPLVVDCLRRTHPDTTYLVASMCDPSVFDLLKRRGNKVIIWHPWFGDALPMIEWLVGFETKSRLLVGFDLKIPGWPNGDLVGTSCAVTRSMQFAPLMGYRTLHLHGIDSSCEEGVVHFDDLDVDKEQPRVAAWVGLKDFPGSRVQVLTTPQMNRQIREYIPLVRELKRAGVEIVVHGDGAIPYLAALRGEHVKCKREVRRGEGGLPAGGTAEPDRVGNLPRASVDGGYPTP